MLRSEAEEWEASVAEAEPPDTVQDPDVTFLAKKDKSELQTGGELKWRQFQQICCRCSDFNQKQRRPAAEKVQQKAKFT